ncbi:hypothetical protein [Psychroserpens ponticola]|uniref:Dihydroorotase n=1 Tax=Psychroserpens ponticola TaxID=2932268 RepID=A0ABY7S0Z7_9FLAO|nr:hypothetical protein [Psychroserpens ponticola]WCO02958.1 hypothetical protein MUN68_005570 [Psychroserpens ponticola]
MKKLVLTLLFLGVCFYSNAQDQPKIGDELIINEPYAQNFNYINFPKPNILIKRGKLGNYSSVYDNIVIVDKVITKENGKTYVILKKKDGSQFFGFLAKVKANYIASIKAKELSIL